MATTRTSANVKNRRYKLLHRTPEAFSLPADASAWTTFLATFTELGYAEDKSIKWEFSDGEEVILDDGVKKKLSKNAKLEAMLLQTEAADFTEYETIENVATDVLAVDTVNQEAVFFPNALLSFNEAVVSGEVAKIPMLYEKENLSAKSEFRTRFAIPQA